MVEAPDHRPGEVRADPLAVIQIANRVRDLAPALKLPKELDDPVGLASEYPEAQAALRDLYTARDALAGFHQAATQRFTDQVPTALNLFATKLHRLDHTHGRRLTKVVSQLDEQSRQPPTGPQ